MKILVIVVTRDCSDLLPFFLRHYSTIADETWAFDDASADGTRELLAQCPKVKLENWPHPGSGIDENLFLQFSYETYPKAAGQFDWVIWVDPDEFVYNPHILNVLRESVGFLDVIRTCGFNMTGNGLPKDDGRQIWETLQTGVRAPVYSKPIVFNPKAIVRWDRGKHHLENCNPRVSEQPLLKLLHYRYLGEHYTRAKNAKNYARCGLKNNDKTAAWTCAPDYDGADKDHEGSPLWSEFAKTKQFNVVDADFYI